MATRRPLLDQPYLENSTYYNGYHGYWAKDFFRPDEHWGSWAKPYVGFFSPSYPDWFLPISVPASQTIQFKFIKRDGAGNVVWEGGSNHSFTTPANGTADTPYYTWQP